MPNPEFAERVVTITPHSKSADCRFFRLCFTGNLYRPFLGQVCTHGTQGDSIRMTVDSHGGGAARAGVE